MASSFPAEASEEIRADIAPHSKLPNELLTEIFQLLIPNPVKIPAGIVNVDPAWVLPGVSKKWRSIVLGIPELWTSVYIEYVAACLHDTETLDIRKVTEISNRVLMRSGDALLSLKIYALAVDMRKWELVTNLILSHAHRIRYLDLEIHDVVLWDLLSLPSLNFKCLEFLSISSFDDDGPTVVFQNSLHLRVVELDIQNDWSSMMPHLPWANLEHLSITEGTNLSPLIAHTIMRQCPNLITLEITLSGHNQTTAAIAPITCLSLKTLLVETHFCTTLADFLGPLTLPCLAHLELTDGEESLDADDGWDYPATLIIIPAFQQLTHLKIDIPIPDGYNMIPFLMSIPNILVLSLPPLSHSALQFLSSPDRLPCLQVLEALIQTTTLSRHLSLLNRRADAGLSTRGILFWGILGRPETYGDDTRIVDKLVGRGLLEVRDLRPRRTSMRDFVPSGMKP